MLIYLIFENQWSPSSGPWHRRSRGSPTVAAATAAKRPHLRLQEPARTTSAPPAAFLVFSFLVYMNYAKLKRIMYRLNEMYLISSLNVVLKFSYWHHEWGAVTLVGAISFGRRQ